MDTAARLEAIEAIKQLKARYFLCMDTKDWHGFGAVFSEDCVMDMSKEAPPGVDPAVMVFRGREQIVAAISHALTSVVTLHHGHTPLIEIVGDDAATGVWALEDNFHFEDGGHMHGYGHYHEKYRLIDGQWHIVDTSVTRLRKVVTAGN